MHPFRGFKILLGITGGIAAYKCPELCRLLIKGGAQVQIVLTENAARFVSPLVMATLSGRQVYSNNVKDWTGMEHIELTRWCDLIIVAPATANFLAKAAHGICDDLLTNVILSRSENQPLACCPAMNINMFTNIATQQNIRTLQNRSVLIWGPAEGEQACGEYGYGSMIEPSEICSNASSILYNDEHGNETARNAIDSTESAFSTYKRNNDLWLSNKTVVITSGSTKEPLDPVRFLSNRSSGQMGNSIGKAACIMGAKKVVFITGPCSENILDSPVFTKTAKYSSVLELHEVVSALDMHKKVMEHLDGCDIFIGCAAVSDYRPKFYSRDKLKKTSDIDHISIDFVKNPDIISDVATYFQKQLDRANFDEDACRNSNYCKPIIVGFAAETSDVESNAIRKLQQKQLDIICANECGLNTKSGFETSYNTLIIIDRKGNRHVFSGSKNLLGFRIFQVIRQFERDET